MLYYIVLFPGRKEVVYEFRFDLIAMIQWFIYIIYMKIPVDICRGASAQVVCLFDVFICILLKAKSVEVIVVIIR